MNRAPRPLGDSEARYFVAVPTAGDLVDLEAKPKAEAILFYLARFLVDAEGRPVYRDELHARECPANLAQRLVEAVGEQMQARP